MKKIINNFFIFFEHFDDLSVLIQYRRYFMKKDTNYQNKIAKTKETSIVFERIYAIIDIGDIHYV